MQKQYLFFNILTFDLPAVNQTFYFAKDDIGKMNDIFNFTCGFAFLKVCFINSFKIRNRTDS